MRTRTILVVGAIVVAAIAGVTYFLDRSETSKPAGNGVVVIPTMPKINELPDLTVHMADQTKVNLRALTGDVVVIFFNPDCDHCQESARELAANKTLLKDWQVYFVTSMEARTAEEFGVNYRLTEPNYKFGHAGVPEVYNAVGPLSEVPTIMIYNDNRFVKKFEGTVAIEQLREFL